MNLKMRSLLGVESRRRRRSREGAGGGFGLGMLAVVRQQPQDVSPLMLAMLARISRCIQVCHSEQGLREGVQGDDQEDNG